MYQQAELGLHFENNPLGKKLDKARLLEKSEKLLSVSAGTNGCDNLQSKQLLQEQQKQHNLESVSTDDWRAAIVSWVDGADGL